MEDKTKGMSIEELEEMSNFAGYLYDQLNVRGLDRRDLFILGFIQGREFTLEQLGIFDEDIDTEITGEPPEIIKKYLEFDKNKNKK